MEIRADWLGCLLLPLVFLGCSATTVVRPGEELFVGEPGTLTTKTGSKLRAHHTLIENDSIVVLESRGGGKSRLAQSEAEKLVVKNRVKGAWRGMMLFAGAGAVLGAIPDPNCGDPCLFPNGGVAGSVFVAVMAAPLGAIVGAIQGSRHDYVFERPTLSKDDSLLVDESALSAQVDAGPGR